MLKAILFDLDQTVLNSADGFRAAEHWLQKELFKFLQAPHWESFIAAYRESRGRGSADTPEQKSELWRAFCHQFEAHPGDTLLDEWSDAYWSHVENGSTLFPETIPVLTRLKEHFLLGLITNASSSDGKPHRLDRFMELKSLFDEVVLCGDEDIPAKPEGEGFQEMLSRLDVPPAEAIYVGDNLVTDIQGAVGADILPVLLRHRDIKWSRPLPEVGGLVRIDSLNPLCVLAPADSVITIRQKLH
jgi:HAD superfamily hydrolase (TIGR01549 family)